MSYTKGKFTIDEIEFIQAATVRVLVAVSKGELDLNLIARQELAQRGFDQDGTWVGFERARKFFSNTGLSQQLTDDSIPPDPNVERKKPRSI